MPRTYTGRLTRWGRRPDFVASKPSSRDLRKLGDALDRAEQRCGCHGRAYHSAFVAYGEAVTARKLYRICALENSGRRPNSGHAALVDAERRLDEIIAARPEFATAREFIEANAAFMLAEARCEIARAKQAPRARLVSADGYVKTGQFKVINGERVPVLEKVE